MNIKNQILNPKILVKSILKVLFAAFLGYIMAITYVSVLISNISFLADPILTNVYSTGSPFTLAQVMAIFGAFGLAAGYSDRVEEELKNMMRLVAILHFVAALCFCMFGLLLPTIPYLEEGTIAYWIILVSVMTTMLGSALSFSWGTIEWLFNIPKILGSKGMEDRGSPSG